MATMRTGFGSGEEDSDDGGNDEEGSWTIGGNKFTTSFDVTVVDQPILTHPKMASISGGQLEYLKAFMDGARLWELVPEVDGSGKPKLDSDGLPVMKQLGKLLKTGSKAFDLINKGVTSYKDIMATYTVRQTSRSDKSDIDSVGTIGNPPKAPKAPKFKDRTWLQVSSNGTIRFAPYITGDYAGFCASHDIKVATGGVCIFTSEDGTTWQCSEWGVKAFKHV